MGMCNASLIANTTKIVKITHKNERENREQRKILKNQPWLLVKFGIVILRQDHAVFPSSKRSKFAI